MSENEENADDLKAILIAGEMWLTAKDENCKTAATITLASILRWNLKKRKEQQSK